jgi:hypothetical protein
MKKSKKSIVMFVLMLTLFTHYRVDSGTNEAHTVKIILPRGSCTRNDGSIKKIDFLSIRTEIFDSLRVFHSKFYSDSIYDYIFFDFNHSNYYYIDWKNVKTFSMSIHLRHDNDAAWVDTTYYFDKIDNVAYFRTCRASGKPWKNSIHILNSNMLKSLDEHWRKKHIEDSIKSRSKLPK